MSDTTRHISDYEQEARGRADFFAIGAIVCAAVVVTLFALHGAPNLLGDRFNADAITYATP